ERLVGVGEVEVADAVLFADLEAPLRVEERRLGAPGCGVCARDLPFAPRVVDRVADLLPEEARGVGRVDHPIGVALAPIVLLEQRPGVGEQVDRDLPLELRLERDGCRAGWHGVLDLLSVDQRQPRTFAEITRATIGRANSDPSA